MFIIDTLTSARTEWIHRGISYSNAQRARRSLTPRTLRISVVQLLGTRTPIRRFTTLVCASDHRSQPQTTIKDTPAERQRSSVLTMACTGTLQTAHAIVARQQPQATVGH